MPCDIDPSLYYPNLLYLKSLFISKPIKIKTLLKIELKILISLEAKTFSSSLFNGRHESLRSRTPRANNRFLLVRNFEYFCDREITVTKVESKTYKKSINCTSFNKMEFITTLLNMGTGLKNPLRIRNKIFFWERLQI